MAEEGSFQHRFVDHNGVFHQGPPQAPDVMHFSTDGEQIARGYEKTDQYFLDLLNFIGFSREELPQNVEIIGRWLVQDEHMASEDKIKILLAFEKPIATVLETRTPFNNVLIQSANYLEDPAYLEEIRMWLQKHRENMAILKPQSQPDILT